MGEFGLMSVSPSKVHWQDGENSNPTLGLGSMHVKELAKLLSDIDSTRHALFSFSKDFLRLRDENDRMKFAMHNLWHINTGLQSRISTLELEKDRMLNAWESIEEKME